VNGTDGTYKTDRTDCERHFETVRFNLLRNDGRAEMSKVKIYNRDCITGMAEELGEGSVRCTITSIPFGALFMYSGKTEDIGNNHDGIDLAAGQFGLHTRFFCEQLYRVMAPGCNVCVHIQQLLRYKNQHGYMGRRDFRGAVVDLFTLAGFEWTGEFVIPKNPQIIAKRLALHSLQFATGKRNSRVWMPAVNDYVMIFQKPGECAEPVKALFDQDENPGGWVTQEDWIRDAHGVWTDIRETDVLEGYKGAREDDAEKHVCPLQLTVIRRLMLIYTNRGELVLDPFMGIGSTAWVAVEEGRDCVGFELKESYCKQAVRNVEIIQEKMDGEDIVSLAERNAAAEATAK
jgi:DNA modification methylase